MANPNCKNMQAFYDSVDVMIDLLQKWPDGLEKTQFNPEGNNWYCNALNRDNESDARRATQRTGALATANNNVQKLLDKLLSDLKNDNPSIDIPTRPVVTAETLANISGFNYALNLKILKLVEDRYNHLNSKDRNKGADDRLFAIKRILQQCIIQALNFQQIDFNEATNDARATLGNNDDKALASFNAGVQETESSGAWKRLTGKPPEFKVLKDAIKQAINDSAEKGPTIKP